MSVYPPLWQMTLLRRTDRNVIIIARPQFDAMYVQTPVFARAVRDWNRRATGRGYLGQ